MYATFWSCGFATKWIWDMFCQDFMFFRTYDFGQTRVFSNMLLFACVYNKIPQPKWPHGPWDHFMVLVKSRLCIDILHSDTTFCEWPLFLIFLCNCMKKLCKCMRRHVSCVNIRELFSCITTRIPVNYNDKLRDLAQCDPN